MNNFKNIYYRAGLLIILGFIAGCSEDFLDRPPKDTLVDANFFKNDDQLLAGSALLYNQVWFDYNDKASYNLGDFRGGTAYSGYNDRENVEFNTTPDTPDNGAAWRAFFNVVGQANTLIHNINTYAGSAVSEEVRNHVIAEARFMRALAYRFLVMNWGAVPIIENNLTLLSDTTKSRNTIASVWKYITGEFRAAAKDLPETPLLEGRLTQWSAEAMLARTYLARAGIGGEPGSRDQQFLDSAKYYSQRVIELSGAALLANYADLFMFPYDNNAESLFSLQWVFSGPDTWGTQNSTPAYLAYSSTIGNGDGWGGDKGATYWMLSLYEGIEMKSDTVLEGKTLDQRLKASFMLPGMKYPEIRQAVEDEVKPLVYPFNDEAVNFAAVKKYVIGKMDATQAASQRYSNDTYMIRLAEMYLVYAEAVLGNNPATTDATALEYFNAVHTRAGLGEFTGPLTFEDIFYERIKEFAMEGMAWYDLVRLHYYNPEKAYEIISQQDRGLFYIAPDQFPDTNSWRIVKTQYALDDNDRYFEANSGNFRIPIPAAEMSSAPNLAKPPVDYYSQGE